MEMKSAIRCRWCGTVLGVSDKKFRKKGNASRLRYPEIPCMGVHTPPVRSERLFFFRMIRAVSLFYVDSKTKDSWYEYVGPPSRFLLWLALGRVGIRPLLVASGEVNWSPFRGFSGRGYFELFYNY